MNMEQKFISVKFVSAIDMNSDEARQKGYKTDCQTNVDGVEVTYEDGYKSWCPLEVFKRNSYSVVTNNQDLVKSVKLMLSEDYKERFKAEYLQILSRATRLEDMLEKWEKGELSFVPTCPKSTFYFQLKAMKMYFFALCFRAEVEGVDLP